MSQVQAPPKALRWQGQFLSCLLYIEFLFEFQIILITFEKVILGLCGVRVCLGPAWLLLEQAR